MYRNPPTSIEPIYVPAEWPDDAMLNVEQCRFVRSAFSKGAA